MQYKTVIDQIGHGSVRETARKLGIPVTTIHHWRQTGQIPHWREEYIRSVARSLGVNVDEVNNE
jgi:hypothetical protein